MDSRMIVPITAEEEGKQSSELCSRTEVNKPGSLGGVDIHPI